MMSLMYGVALEDWYGVAILEDWYMAVVLEDWYTCWSQCVDAVFLNLHSQM